MDRRRDRADEERAVEAGDLEAALGARRELGPEYEPALVESFVEKIESAVDARVEARLATASRDADADRELQRQQLVLGMVSLGTGIPITAVAGGTADLPGILVAWAGIAAVNVAHALQGRRRRR